MEEANDLIGNLSIETQAVHREADSQKAVPYERISLLGDGTFSQVYLLRDKRNSKRFAGKRISKTTLEGKSNDLKKVLNEVEIHRSLNHDNIVKFVDCFETANAYYIIMEYCPKMTLWELLKRRTRFNEKVARSCLRQILAAVSYLHGNDIIHRDLKPENIFLKGDSYVVKVGDFGLALHMNDIEINKGRRCGTRLYMAPEVLKSCKIGPEIDIWAFGCIIFDILVGHPAFEDKDDNEITRKVLALGDGGTIEFDKRISAKAKDLITRILKYEPRERPSIEEILQHEFFAGYETTPVVKPLKRKAKSLDDRTFKRSSVTQRDTHTNSSF